MKENDLILHYDVLLSVFRARGDRETSISLLPVQTLLIFLGDFIRAKSLFYIHTSHVNKVSANFEPAKGYKCDRLLSHLHLVGWGGIVMEKQ